MINNADPVDGVVAFLHVAGTLHFRRSAEALGVTPAAISRTIGRLEERLGARLLERTTRAVRLTAEGAAYAARCREAYAQLRLAEDELSLAQRVPHGTLGVSCSHILAPFFAPILARFLGRYPALRADLRVTDRVVRFAEEEVDVGLRVGGIDDPDLVVHVLARPRWVTVASPAYLARRGVPRTPADLSGHACVRFVPPRGRPRRWTFADGPDVAVEGPLDVDRGDLLVSAALADLGIARVLEFMVVRELSERRLVEVLPGSVRVPLSAVHLPSRRATPRVRALIRFLRGETVFPAAPMPRSG